MDSRTVETPGSPAEIQAATWRDMLTVRQLERICFPQDAWPLLDIIGVLTLPNVIRLKAVTDGQIVGFIATDIRRSQNQAWVATIGVVPDYQRRGIGRALLRASEVGLNVGSIRLSVRASNMPAIRLYEQDGYEQVGVWPRYYQNGEDALVFEKRLNSRRLD